MNPDKGKRVVVDLAPQLILSAIEDDTDRYTPHLNEMVRSICLKSLCMSFSDPIPPSLTTRTP